MYMYIYIYICTYMHVHIRVYILSIGGGLMSLMGAYDDDEAEEEAAKVQRIFGVNVRIGIFSGIFPAKRIYACMYIHVYDAENKISYGT